MSSADERELARRVSQGDREAYGELMRHHQGAVFNVAYRVIGDVHEAEDAAQETFIRAYRFFDKYDLDRPLGPWLKRIAVNVSLNRLEARKSASSLDDEAPGPGTDSLPGPESQVMTRQHEARLRAELARLPPRYRAVIELRHFQDLSYQQMAHELKRPVSDVKSDLFRARRLLAERLKDLA
jgi:RNA polymerase sigma-70 factor (ECF subfamily)